VFKANSAVLNSLLTILNERLFDNGSARVPVPLLCLVGASNELPDSEELDALYDRFLLRCAVAQVSDAGVNTLLALPARNGDGGDGDGHHATDDGDGGTPQLQLRAEALAGVRRAAAGVEVPPDIRGLLKELRSHLQNLQPPVYVSGARNGACVSCVSCSMLTH
jgi:MoxR-like ATPase